MNDELEFIQEADAANLVTDAPSTILLIDDDIDVHKTTSFALTTAMMNSRPLKLIHTYSGEDAIQFSKTMSQIALILVEIAMEIKYAGMDVARWEREAANYSFEPIIVLRTGQPGIFSFYDVENESIYQFSSEKT